MKLIAVDPGLRACGVAVFDDGKLSDAMLLENAYPGDERTRLWTGMYDAFQRRFPEGVYFFDDIVVEKPQIYDRSPNKNNLVDLSIIAGAAALALYGRNGYGIVDYWPHEWKGNVDKKVMTERIRGWMSLDELAVLPTLPKAKIHNVIDAVGLGIHRLSVLGLRRKGPAK